MASIWASGAVESTESWEPWEPGEPWEDPETAHRPHLSSTPEPPRKDLEGWAHRITRGRDLLRRRETVHRQPPFRFAVPELDARLGTSSELHGIERGTVLELHADRGARSAGRSALVLSLLAAATRSGEAAALVDLGDGLDVVAAEAAGCVFGRLLWIRPSRWREALAATEIALCGGFPLVVLDVGPPPVRGLSRSASSYDGVWMRLQRTAEAQRAALVLSLPYRASGPAASTVIGASPARGLWLGRGEEPRLLAGLDARFAIEKTRHGHGERLDARQVPVPFAAAC
jgi:hypothetical protein